MNIFFILLNFFLVNYFKMSVGKTHTEFATLLKMLLCYELVMDSYG